MRDFIDYVLDFYGVGGVYDMGVTWDDAFAATIDYVNEYLPDDNTKAFQGDAWDREGVREVLIDDYGYLWPKG